MVEYPSLEALPFGFERLSKELRLVEFVLMLNKESLDTFLESF